MGQMRAMLAPMARQRSAAAHGSEGHQVSEVKPGQWLNTSAAA